MAISFDLSHKTVVVVGGTSGIGLGVAKTFADQACNVVVASRKPEKVEAAVKMLNSCQGNALGFVADVRDEDAIAKGLEEAVAEYGEIDILVSGAAGNFLVPFQDLSSNGFQAVMDIDLLGTFHVLKNAYPHLKKPGASVINISAPQAYIATENQSHVCAAKAAVDQITRCLALEWGPQGVRVNSVVPGPIAATQGAKLMAPTQALMDLALDSVPLKRVGSSEDIGNMCLLLSSPLADYVTGAVIPVDGGWSLGGVPIFMKEANHFFAENLTKK